MQEHAYLLLPVSICTKVIFVSASMGTTTVIHQGVSKVSCLFNSCVVLLQRTGMGLCVAEKLINASLIMVTLVILL